MGDSISPWMGEPSTVNCNYQPGFEMKKIEAIIQPSAFERVKEALEEADYPGITITEVKGHGKQMGLTQNWLGRSIRVDTLPKMKLEIVAKDEEGEKIIQTILQSAWSGKKGDGKVFVHRIEQAYKISSGETGDSVVS